MPRLLLFSCFLCMTTGIFAQSIIVKNIDELKDAEKKAAPGDIIILKDGEWKDVTIKLNCKGSESKPIKFKAETAGRVFITGHSQLRIGGEWLVVDGLYFRDGYAGDDAVINFRSGKDELADHCQVTNCVIESFNDPKRLDENYWVAFYGKNNRLDHCSFRGKNNLGVLLAVILDDDRSRENFHSIDHNYFGQRVPLASNGGEIIRVGVSQHCQYNSNTMISYNFFEHCDGETEVVSIKSCANIIEGNIFKECQGSVVLRHGNNNTVANNYFLGNNKPGTGGVRIINKGQSVVANIFYKCRGVDFRSPMAIMNGIPNSPANRYVQVIDAKVLSNTFYECSSITLCEGSDTERSLPPKDVKFEDNTFYNTRDPFILKINDDISGFQFANNKVSSQVRQSLEKGFIKTNLSPQLPNGKKASADPTLPSIANMAKVEKDLYMASGPNWFAKQSSPGHVKPFTISCATTEEMESQLARIEKNEVTLLLTGTTYTIDKPLMIQGRIKIKADKKKQIKFVIGKADAVFIIEGNGNLSLEGLDIDGSDVRSGNFIMSSDNGSSSHYNLSVRNCSLQGFNHINLFFASKSIVADSIIIRNNNFHDNIANTFMMADEKDDKGYYNAEKIIIADNNFSKQQGILIDIYRGGNDESTLGPNFSFTKNKLTDCNSTDAPLILLTGVQVSSLLSNSFTNCNPAATVIKYKDFVRAKHLLDSNDITNSGRAEKNKFVTERNSRIK